MWCKNVTLPRGTKRPFRCLEVVFPQCLTILDLTFVMILPMIYMLYQESFCVRNVFVCFLFCFTDLILWRLLQGGLLNLKYSMLLLVHLMNRYVMLVLRLVQGYTLSHILSLVHILSLIHILCLSQTRSLSHSHILDHILSLVLGLGPELWL